MHRDVKEFLIGSACIILFGVALIVWPPLGMNLRSAVHIPLDFVLGLFS